MKQFILFLCPLVMAGYNSFGQAVPVINILYTSDAHFGITRKQFRGDTAVPSYKVNAAMIAQMNTMPGIRLPLDNGVGAGKDISNVSYLVESGDIANRMEPPYQSASASWQQFLKVYQSGLKLNAPDGKPTQLLLLAGNHDISNAIGYPKKMEPLKDATVMVEIHKLMMPGTPVPDEQSFDYATGKIHYSKNIGGVHFMFINLWADSAERIWMAADLKNVDKKTPVIIFAHDQPTCEAKHFNNPLSPGVIVPGSKFENLLGEKYKEANQAEKGEHATDLEQHGWEEFLKQHANIKAYFHGNSNFNEFYTYHGPAGGVNLPVFRVDSPIKGDISSKDETKLSFQLISLDPQKKILTVRECLWNTHPLNPQQQVTFGSVKTISL